MLIESIDFIFLSTIAYRAFVEKEINFILIIYLLNTIVTMEVKAIDFSWIFAVFCHVQKIFHLEIITYCKNVELTAIL